MKRVARSLSPEVADNLWAITYANSSGSNATELTANPMDMSGKAFPLR
ncbi:hypothetical protein HRE53_22800 [Acaryochloris sp. 'Moss Beach']|nr:hypothetical protein [Acaryochloris sp. 'Moss Beach']UJB69184.1 hypothetical protein HRE53_22800 [Acaryochloris sp. 'Moss Beach']